MFTIRTYRYPLTILKEQREMALGLQSIVQQLSPEMQLYKNLQPIRETLLTFLEEVQH